MDQTNHRRMHLATGVLGGTALSIYLSPVVAAIYLGTNLLTYSFPDIDSKISFLKHRGFTHTVWAGGILSFGVGYGASYFHPLGLILGASLFLSYNQHIIEDMFTNGGGFQIRPFWPLAGTSFSFGRWKFDSIWFSVLTYLALIGAIGGSVWLIDSVGIIDIEFIYQTYIEPVKVQFNRYI